MLTTEREVAVMTENTPVHPAQALQAHGLRLIVGTNHGRPVLQDQLKYIAGFSTKGKHKRVKYY